MSLWLGWGQWLMDGINWYMLIYLFLYLFSIYFQKRISRMPASCTINATIIYTSIFILYNTPYICIYVVLNTAGLPEAEPPREISVAAERRPSSPAQPPPLLQLPFIVHQQHSIIIVLNLNNQPAL